VFTVGAKRYSDIRPVNLLWLCLGTQLLGRKEEIKESRLNKIRIFNEKLEQDQQVKKINRERTMHTVTK
jgi:hypothetical protein